MPPPPSRGRSRNSQGEARLRRNGRAGIDVRGIHRRRHGGHPLYAKIKEIIDSGAIGTIRHTSWIITTWWRPQGYYEQSAWRATWGCEGGGVLVNQAPHQLDLWQLLALVSRLGNNWQRVDPTTAA